MRCNPSRWLWGLIPIAMLTWGTYYQERPNVEADLTVRATEALSRAGQPWAKVTMTGRDAVITGRAEKDGEPKAALDAVRSVWGIRTVQLKTDLGGVALAPERIGPQPAAPEAVDVAAARKAEEDAAAAAALKAKEEAEAEAQRKAEEEAAAAQKAKEEAEAAAALKAQQEAEAAAALKAKEEAEAAARQKAEEEAEAARKAQEDAEAAAQRAKEEAEAEVQRKTQEDAEAAAAQRAKEQTEEAIRAQQEAEAAQRAQEEAAAAQKAKEEAEAEAAAALKAQQETEAAQRAREEAEAEAQRKAQEEAEAEARRKAEEEAAAAQKAKQEADMEAEAKADAEAQAKKAAARKTTPETTACEQRLTAAAADGIILFSRASADIDPKSSLTIAKLAEIIKRCPGARVEVEGHTDSEGTDERNQRLSDRRARAVINSLVRAGVAEDRLSAVGYGASRPVAPNDTPEGMARNRRIEFKVYTD